MAFKLESIFGFKDQSSGPIRGVLGNLKGLNSGMGMSTRSAGLLGNATQRAFGLGARTAGIATRAVSAYHATTDRARHAQERLNTSMEKTRSLTAGLRSGFSGIAITAGIVAGGVGLIGKSVIDQMGYIEQQRIGLTTMLRSREKGNVTLTAALKFADVTPFDTKEVLDSTRLGLGMGFTRGQLGPLLKTLGDTASGLSLGGAGWSDLVKVFGQIKAAGKINAEDIGQLRDRGIGAWSMLARGLGVTEPAAQKMVEKGLVSSTTGINILLTQMKKDFGGMMEAQSRTVFGLASTLKSRMTGVFANLEGQGALKPVQGFLSNLATLTSPDSPTGKRLTTGVEKTISRVMGAIFNPLSKATGGKRGEQMVTSWLNKLDSAASWLEGNWPRIVKGARQFWAGFTGVFKGARESFEPVVKGVNWVSEQVAKLSGKQHKPVDFAWLAGAAVGALALGGALRTVNTLLLGIPGGLAKLAGRGAIGAVKGAGGLLGKGLGAAGRAATLRIPALLELRTNPGGMLGGLRTLAGNLFRSIGPTFGRVTGFISRIAGGVARFLPTIVRVGATIGRVFLGLSNPIGWVITAITAVVGVGIWAYHRFAWFRSAVDTVWNGIKTGAQLAWRAIQNAITSAASAVVGTVSAGWTTLSTGAQNAWNTISTGATNAWNTLKSGAESAMGFLASLPDRALKIGAGIMSGLKDGITGGIATATGAISGAAQSVISKFKSVLGINSPSRVFMGLGNGVMKGAAMGITRGAPLAVTATRRASRDVVQAGQFAPARVAVPAALARSSAGGRNLPPITFTVNVPPGAFRQDGSTPADAGRIIGRNIASELTEVFEQLASQI